MLKTSFEQATCRQNPTHETIPPLRLDVEQTRLHPIPDVGYHDSAAIAPEGVLQQSGELAVTIRNMYRLALQREITLHLVNKIYV